MTEYLAFPFAIQAGRAATVDLDTHVRQIIEIVLFTEPGERVNRPAFGAGADRLVFEPDNDALAVAVKHLVQGALQRASGGLFHLHDLSVSADDAMLTVRVTYSDTVASPPKTLVLERSQ